jgi:alanine racemase
MQGFPLTLWHCGKPYRVLPAGRICMDQMMLDLTDTPARVGDTVCLWQDARSPAAHLDTIPYEILSTLSPRVTRVDCKEKL